MKSASFYFGRAIARAAVPGFLAVAAAILTPVTLHAADAVVAEAKGPTADGSARVLTLQDAIAGALAKNENIHIERVALDSARAAVTGAKGAYDPRLALNAGWESAKVPVNSAFSGAPEGEPAPTDRTTGADASLEKLLSTGALVSITTGSSRATTTGAFALLSPAYETQLGVELRQPLLRDRAIDPARLTLRVAAADRDRAVGSLRQQVTDTVAAVERAYWDLVAARRAVGVQEEAVALASRQLHETQARIESGAAPEDEIAQPRAALERRRGDLLAAREASSRAQTALKVLILGDDTTAWAQPLDPVDEIAVEATRVDLATAMDKALASRPELEVAEADIQRRRAETAFARDRVRPALDLVASYNRFGLAGSRNAAGAGLPGLPTAVPSLLQGNLGDAVSQLGSGDFDDARVALQFRVAIGNRTARANAAIARDAQAQAEESIAATRKAIRAEVLDAAAATETAGARIEAARAERRAAEVQLAAEEDRFQAGLSTNFLVLTRQNDLAAAKLAEINALSDYRKARTELARATGTLLEERRIELE